MPNTKIPVDPKQGWLNATQIAVFQPGDKINIQNIGSGAITVKQSETMPIEEDLGDFVLYPSKQITLSPADGESIYVISRNGQPTKISITRNSLTSAAAPEVQIVNNLDTLIEVTLGVPTAGLKSFIDIKTGAQPPTAIYAFQNTGDKILAASFQLTAVNDTNSRVGICDIEVEYKEEALTGGSDFSATDILEIRGIVDVTGKINPTNTTNLARFERIHVPPNSGKGRNKVSDFLMNPNEAIFIKVTPIDNLIEYVLSASFGRG